LARYVDAVVECRADRISGQLDARSQARTRFNSGVGIGGSELPPVA
jgi:hypothetical protein